MGFWVCSARMNCEKVSEQAQEFLVPWLVLFVLALLGLISWQKKNPNKCSVDSLCMYQLFLL